MHSFRELTPEEAEAAYEAAEPVPMTEAEIMRIVRYVMVADGRAIPITPEEVAIAEQHMSADIELPLSLLDPVAILNRNRTPRS